MPISQRLRDRAEALEVYAQELEREGWKALDARSSTTDVTPDRLFKITRGVRLLAGELKLESERALGPGNDDERTAERLAETIEYPVGLHGDERTAAAIEGLSRAVLAVFYLLRSRLPPGGAR